MNPALRGLAQTLDGLGAADARVASLWLARVGSALAETAANPILRLFFAIVSRFAAEPAPLPTSASAATMAEAASRLIPALSSGDPRLGRGAVAQLVHSAGGGTPAF